MISRRDFIRTVAQRAGFTIGDVTAISDASFEVLAEILKEGEEVKMMTGVTLVSELKPEHSAVNPRNGEAIVVPAKMVARAKIGKQLKEAINE